MRNLLFGARAQGGVTAAEARRREEIALAHARGELPIARELPPPMPHFQKTAPVIAPCPADAPAAIALAPAEGDAEPATAAAERRDAPAVGAWSPPVLRVVIIGPPHSGKSALAHHLRQSLGYEGFVASGPDRLATFNWRRSLQRLIERGTRIELVEEDAAPAGDGEGGDG